MVPRYIGFNAVVVTLSNISIYLYIYYNQHYAKIETTACCSFGIELYNMSLVGNETHWHARAHIIGNCIHASQNSIPGIRCTTNSTVTGVPGRPNDLNKLRIN